VTEDVVVEIIARASLPTSHGGLEICAFSGLSDGREHVAIVKGDIAGTSELPTRLHSQCITGDVLASLRCDCRTQLELSLQHIAAQERGLVLYLRQEGRGIGLVNKIRAYALQDEGLDTVEANHALGFHDDERDYTAAAEMLRCLEVRSVLLMTNNPSKIAQLEQRGIRVSGRLPHETLPNEHNARYLETKKRKSGHLLDMLGADRPRPADILHAAVHI
jgi:GTP cyclohydrolase II